MLPRAVWLTLLVPAVWAGSGIILVSPTISHSIKLTPFRPVPGDPSGLLVVATVQGGKPLRLVLDSGAHGITVGRRAVIGLKLRRGGESEIQGLADDSRTAATTATARVMIGTFAIDRCPMEVTDGSITPGADGVVGLNVFEPYRISIDARKGVMNLSLDEDENTGAPLFRQGDLLFVKVKVNHEREGLFLVDTGSAYTVISRDVARSMPALGPVQLVARCGTRLAGYRVPAATFEIGGRTVSDVAPVAMDLRNLSTRHSVEISGILGYSVLGKTVFTIDYGAGRLRLK